MQQGDRGHVDQHVQDLLSSVHAELRIGVDRMTLLLVSLVVVTDVLLDCFEPK